MKYVYAALQPVRGEDYLELLSPVALGAVPLHYGFPDIQQEYVSVVEAVPWHLHLHVPDGLSLFKCTARAVVKKK